MNEAVDREQTERRMHEQILESRALTPQGAGLRRVGPASRRLLLAEWSYVSQYYPEDLVVTVGAGTRLQALQQVLGQRGQWMPLAPVDGGDDTLGGAIAAGLEGWFVGGYGPFRDRVLGLRVVTPAFGPLFIGSRVVKNVAGYNMPRLFVGTRGALGVITEVTLKASPRPPIEAIWQVNVSESDVRERAQQWIQATGSWASIAVIRDNARYVLQGVWHGRQASFESLRSLLGPPGADATPVWFGRQEAVQVAGAVAPGRVWDVLDRWPKALPVLLDLKTGTLFACPSNDRDWLGAKDMVSSALGAVRILRDADSRLGTSPHQDPLWRDLKQRFDPDGCLTDLMG